MKLWLLLILAVIIGLIIGWVDSRPTWDDAGVTVGMILLVTAMFGVVPSNSTMDLGRCCWWTCFNIKCYTS